MTAIGWAQIALYCVIVVALTKPLGGYMTRVFTGERTFLGVVLRPIETGFYRLAGVDARTTSTGPRMRLPCCCSTRAASCSCSDCSGCRTCCRSTRRGLQGLRPISPSTPPSASSPTPTGSRYGGESTMSYLTQMLGLTVQNFLSAATGIALALALIRGFARKSAQGIGNFWVDLVRCTLYVLLPICFVAALFFVWQGMPQNLNAYVEATTLEGAQQTIAQGPVASQLAIKMLGTNGGGFFNANSAHPYENPTALSNFVQMLLIFAIGAALTNVFGRMVGDQRQGWAILAAMGVLFLAGVAVAYWAEAHANPALASLGVDPAGGNMEGKEVRFGVPLSALFAVITTDASCGAVNAMHDSFLPLGGMIPLINIQLGEIIVGGVGAGLYGMLLFVIIALFVAGLMVGRTPEYLGKKLEAKEVKMTMLAILCLPLSYLGFTAIASAVPAGVAGILNPGPHGFSEMLYAYTSGTGNNGSAFAGLSANSRVLQPDPRHWPC